jgi:hypothetical protein
LPKQAGVSTVNATLPASDVQLWWPNGYGDQPLYTVSMTAEVQQHQQQYAAGESSTTNSSVRLERNIGFRTLNIHANAAVVAPPASKCTTVPQPCHGHANVTYCISSNATDQCNKTMPHPPCPPCPPLPPPSPPPSPELHQYAVNGIVSCNQLHTPFHFSLESFLLVFFLTMHDASVIYQSSSRTTVYCVADNLCQRRKLGAAR